MTITEYDRLTRDGTNSVLPIGQAGMKSSKRTSNGTFPALDPSASFVRVATDTAIELTFNGTSMFFPAQSVEYIGVSGGEVLTVVTI